MKSVIEASPRTVWTPSGVSRPGMGGVAFSGPTRAMTPGKKAPVASATSAAHAGSRVRKRRRYSPLRMCVMSVLPGG